MTDMVTLPRGVVERALSLLDAYAERDDIQHLAGIVDVPRELRAALAQAGQGEAVAWRKVFCVAEGEIEDCIVYSHHDEHIENADCFVLYARTVAPPPAPAVPEGWVACSERMPEEDRNVLLFSTDVGYTIACVYRGKLKDYFGLLRPDAAHWMPLPPPPQQGG